MLVGQVETERYQIFFPILNSNHIILVAGDDYQGQTGDD